MSRLYAFFTFIFLAIPILSYVFNRLRKAPDREEELRLQKKIDEIGNHE